MIMLNPLRHLIGTSLYASKVIFIWYNYRVDSRSITNESAGVLLGITMAISEHLIYGNIDNGLVPAGNQPLSGPMLTQIYVSILRH